MVATDSPAKSKSNPQKRRKPDTPIERAARAVHEANAAAFSTPDNYTPPSPPKDRPRLARCPSPYWTDLARARRSAIPPRVDTLSCAWRECQSGKLRCGRMYPAAYVRGRSYRSDASLRLNDWPDNSCHCEDCVNEASFRWSKASYAQGFSPHDIAPTKGIASPTIAGSLERVIPEKEKDPTKLSDPLPTDDDAILTATVLAMADIKSGDPDAEELQRQIEYALEKFADCAKSR